MNKLVFLTIMVLLLLNMLHEITGDDKCFQRRYGPRRGKCVDRHPRDRYGRGQCARTGRGYACQPYGRRCRCEYRFAGRVFNSPTRDSEEFASAEELLD